VVVIDKKPIFSCTTREGIITGNNNGIISFIITTF
jgi:hypothetical protein